MYVLSHGYSLEFIKVNLIEKKRYTLNKRVVKFNNRLMDIICLRPKVNGQKRRQSSIRDYRRISKNRLFFLAYF